MPTSSAEAALSQPAFLQVRDLAAGYGREPVISGITMSADRGEIACVVGPNGSGKSTFLKALLGEIRVMNGSVTLDGREVANLPAHTLARLGLGYVPQVHDVFDTLSVEENLRIGAYMLNRREASERIATVMARFPTLKPLLRRSAHKLSGGERKLVAIGRVMMLQPDVYVLDEPTSGLSPQLTDQLLQEHVAALAKSGAAILLVEQKAKAALEISDRGYLLVAGRLRMSAAAKEMLADASVAEMFLGQGPDEGEGPDEADAPRRAEMGGP
jgi:branched-chain amino acid transport system ATP-binding protein